jgi:hypothetical protein
MNDYDIDNAFHRASRDSVKRKAIRILINHKDIVNNNSDGWAYWKAPVQAAQKLMQLIKGPNTISEVTAAECLKIALRPIKSFYTKHPQLPRPEGLDD